MDILSSFWPWYVTGPLIGLYVPAIYLLLNKHFGISSTFRDICTVTVRPKARYFQYNWRDHSWRLVFVAGIVIGGFLGHPTLTTAAEGQISGHTLDVLASLGLKDFTSLVPPDLFSWNAIFSLRGFFLLVVGGFLVGFGTRYADGCTSGHTIHGVSNFHRSSLVATLCFFIGGLFSTYVLLPLILNL
ncbi:MAG: YeeE/YedE thiosulfate transporter family protein [Bacteroidota bacterium]